MVNKVIIIMIAICLYKTKQHSESLMILTFLSNLNK